jgi:hypothetical protein
MLSTPARLLVAAAAVVTVAGCDSSNPVEALPDVTGTYTLVDIGGEAPPVTLLEDDFFRIDLISGTLILRANGTYSEPLLFEFTDKTDDTSERETGTDTGTYTVLSATALTFTSDDPDIGSYSATISGNELTYSFEGTQIRYRK